MDHAHAQPLVLSAPRERTSNLKFYGLMVVITYWTLTFLGRKLLLDDVLQRFAGQADPQIFSVAAHVTLAIMTVVRAGLLFAAWGLGLLALRLFAHERPASGKLLGALGVAHLPLLCLALWSVLLCAGRSGEVPFVTSAEDLGEQMHLYLNADRFVLLRRIDSVLQVVTLAGASEIAHRALGVKRWPLWIAFGLVAVVILKFV